MNLFVARQTSFSINISPFFIPIVQTVAFFGKECGIVLYSILMVITIAYSIGTKSSCDDEMYFVNQDEQLVSSEGSFDVIV